ncbi:hypothetical protein B0T16DRAFT_429654 [Cercophora newfieldiana]|uniref:RBR-type E3 ubiquitin transferase n=1 Tax=Cercophora newfieldiana TaxID=92897 RepID=A0AA39Y7B9_9PEZI|nr:hypothetical protein B0T16DRAFT_429654 [Cercophora newfieldiana]
MEIYNFDPETMRVVLLMQLEDLDELARTINAKGKNRDGDVPDAVAAVEAYRLELTECSQILADRAICRSVAQAVDLDAAAIRALLAEEERAIQDRDLAFRLAGKPNPRAAAPATQPTTLSADWGNPMDIDADDYAKSLGNAESSKWAASRADVVEMKTCVVCGDEHRLFNICTSNACGHSYCRGCLVSLFQASMKDESLFPPKCCGNPITIQMSRHILSAELIGTFNAKKIEFETPNRTYCSDLKCSTFIPPQAIKGGVATCVRCRANTCAVCKKAEHQGQDCPDDPATQALLRLAKEQQWQKCYKCAHLVELNHGCNHITCHCGAEFCYECGEGWKTCRCAQWEEGRLLARTNAIVDRDRGAHRLDANRHANLVERTRRNLVANHQCQHRTWGRWDGANRCENCHERLPQYLYECERCHIMVCHRCRYNRRL